MSEQVNMTAHYEHEIPEGYEARIEGNKVIFVPKESEDEKMRKWIISYLKNRKLNSVIPEEIENCEKAIAYLERQKEQIVIKQNIIDSIRANTQPDWDFSTIPNLHKEINRFFGEKFILPHTENTIITVSDVIRCAYHFYNFGKHEQKPAEYEKPLLSKFEQAVYDCAWGKVTCKPEGDTSLQNCFLLGPTSSDISRVRSIGA